MVSQADFLAGPLADFGRTFTRVQAVETLDSYGAKTARTETETSITGITISLTEKDRQLISQGLSVPGDMRFFVKGDVSLNVGDIIKDSTKQWRVVQLNERKDGTDTIIFISALLRNINLEE